MMKKSTKIKRESAADTEATGGEAAVGRVMSNITPVAISLVGRPASQIPHRVVRSAPRISRSDTSKNPILRLIFPADLTESDATALLASYGMSDYTLSKEERGYVATRADLQTIASEVDEICLDTKGTVALVARSEPSAAAQGAIQLAQFEFPESFTQESATEWLVSRGVTADVVDTDGKLTASRAEVGKDEDVRRMEVEDGVVCVVRRADILDVPATMALTMEAAAYGNWGWGYVDFNAATADREYCNAIDSAIYRLRDVLENILFGALDLAQKKALTQNAANQFSAYVGSIIDRLPQQVIVATMRSEISRSDNQEIDEMGKDTEGTPTKSEGADAPSASTTITMSRDEFSALIKEAVEAGKASAATSEPVAREEPADAQKDDKQEAAPAAISRSDFDSLGDTLKSVNDRLAALEGSTVVRNDAAVEVPAKDKAPAKVRRNDVICLGALSGVTTRR